MSGQNKKNKLMLVITAILLLAISGMVLCYFQNRKETAPAPSISKEENEKEASNENEKPVTPVPIPAPPEVWKTYVSSELGFSIKYPEMVYGINRCDSTKPFYVPLKVFEDNENGIVYITEEYYYDDWNSELQNNTRQCKKIINSLESLNEQRAIVVDINGEVSLNSNPFLTRVFVIKDIKNDTELNKFIKDNYGPSCFEKNREQVKQSSVYDIAIKGTDWNKDGDGNSERVMTCAWNYMYKILYAPAKNKAMSVNLGQECGFYIIDPTNINLPECYDDIMIDSFEFK